MSSPAVAWMEVLRQSSGIYDLLHILKGPIGGHYDAFSSMRLHVYHMITEFGN